MAGAEARALRSRLRVLWSDALRDTDTFYHFQIALRITRCPIGSTDCLSTDESDCSLRKSRSSESLRPLGRLKGDRALIDRTGIPPKSTDTGSKTCASWKSSAPLVWPDRTSEPCESWRNGSNGGEMPQRRRRRPHHKSPSMVIPRRLGPSDLMLHHEAVSRRLLPFSVPSFGIFPLLEIDSVTSEGTGTSAEAKVENGILTICHSPEA